MKRVKLEITLKATMFVPLGAYTDGETLEQIQEIESDNVQQDPRYFLDAMDAAGSRPTVVASWDDAPAV